MAQVFDPLPSDSQSRILCCYVNATSHMQIARISNIPNWYFERVVFPGQRLLFEALADAQLEIHTGMMASAILSDTLSCASLRIDQDAEPPLVAPDQERELRNEAAGIGKPFNSIVEPTPVLTSIEQAAV